MRLNGRDSAALPGHQTHASVLFGTANG